MTVDVSPERPEAEKRPRRSRPSPWVLLVGAALVVGVLARMLVSGGAGSGFLSNVLPWMGGTSVTLYFSDGSVDHLVPVSRTLDGEDDSAEGLLIALLGGPADGTGLENLLPAGTELRSASVDGAVIRADVSSAYLDGRTPLTDTALLQSMASWPGVSEVRLTVEGAPLTVDAASRHLSFFYDPAGGMLVAEPVDASGPRDILNSYLAGPATDDLVGLPPDVEVLGFDTGGGNGLIKINMTYTPAVREFATSDGNGMRRVLEGLIATLTTGFPDTQYVYLDFEGHATLGLGQCANLLRRVQPPPETLNDERLLSPAPGA